MITENFARKLAYGAACAILGASTAMVLTAARLKMLAPRLLAVLIIGLIAGWTVVGSFAPKLMRP